MDDYNFKGRRPTEGDVIIRRTRMTAEQVADYSSDEDGDGFIKYEPRWSGDVARIIPLGDESLDEKLVLHIPLSEVKEKLKKIRNQLRETNLSRKASVELIVRISEGCKDDSSWDVSWVWEPIDANHPWQHHLVYPENTEVELEALAVELLEVAQDNFEQV